RGMFFLSSRRRHTRSKRDWSSDVCSSDLPAADERALHGAARAGAQGRRRDPVPPMRGRAPLHGTRVRIALTDRPGDEAVVRVIADRKSAVEGRSGGLGGRGTSEKKTELAA